jgi:hypothetical protein
MWSRVLHASSESPYRVIERQLVELITCSSDPKLRHVAVVDERLPLAGAPPIQLLDVDHLGRDAGSIASLAPFAR